MTDARVQTLVQESKFLSSLPREAAEKLAAAARARVLRPGEYAARAGDPAFGLAWLHSGLVFIFFEMSDGSRVPYLVAWPSSVSFDGLLGEGQFPASSTALTPATFVWITREVAEEVAGQHPDLMNALFDYAVRQGELRAIWLGRLFSLPLRSRVRLLLARMAVEMGQPGEGGRILDFPVSHRTLAIIAQVSRDEVGRAVRELLAEEVIERIEGRRFLVPDLRRLLGPSLLESTVAAGLIPEIR
ncbi:hypothetical protein AMK68_03475 [candidate division KD3-62 bacterium DG_56]|uniref:Cyclic nucleotide-binding domain-containing protein n=1 Tax=candidate division KD3-62 bacterium DG_56 TaxID=1704032 RepID=A0A0S7XME0_9BACT|nr:MAG: hypothetical protein AMK68_03475 [candidate division KD3-62 bacterium DG_56]